MAQAGKEISLEQLLLRTLSEAPNELINAVQSVPFFFNTRDEMFTRRIFLY